LIAVIAVASFYIAEVLVLPVLIFVVKCTSCGIFIAETKNGEHPARRFPKELKLN
tara:strand:- start:495 stop:659 length:165 start_codon:yes stop_codon:yes gene_type:complete